MINICNEWIAVILNKSFRPSDLQYDVSALKCYEYSNFLKHRKIVFIQLKHYYDFLTSTLNCVKTYRAKITDNLLQIQYSV